MLADGAVPLSGMGASWYFQAKSRRKAISFPPRAETREGRGTKREDTAA